MGYKKLLKTLQEIGRLPHNIPGLDDKVDELVTNDKRTNAVEYLDDNAECELFREGSKKKICHNFNTKEFPERARLELTNEEGLCEGDKQHLSLDDKPTEASGILQGKVGKSAVSPSVTKDDVSSRNNENDTDSEIHFKADLGAVTREGDTARATLATATVLPFSLVDNKKVWLWILALICVIIAACFLWRWHSKRKEVALSTSEKIKTCSGDLVRDFMNDYR